MNIHVSLSISGHVMSALVFIICSTQVNGVFELGRGLLTLHVVKNSNSIVSVIEEIFIS